MKDDKLKLYYAISAVAGIFTAVVGLFVLAGWILNVPLMKSVLPGLVTMKANTAVCFALIGSSLWSLQVKRIDKNLFRILGKSCASAVLLIGAATLYEYISGNNLGIDQLLFQEPAGAVFTTYPGRMALITAVNFFIMGIALLSLDVKTKRGYYPSQFLAVAAGFITLSALCGYAYGVSSFSGRIAIYTAMALHTVIAFIILCLGLLFARPDKGSAGVLTSRLSGGTMMRRLLLVIVAVPTLSGWFKLQGEKAGLYNNQFGTALMVISNVALLIIVAWAVAAAINSAQKEHEADKTRIAAANEEWKMTFDSMSDPTFIIDMDNTITNVNSALASFLKTDPRNIIGKKCYEIMHGAGAPIMNCPMEKTKHDSVSHIEEVNDPHIGVPLLVTTSPIFDKNHKMVAVVHAAKDISLIKKAEETLRESETKYRAIFEFSSDAIMTADREKGFLSGNPATVKMFGCKDEKEFISYAPADLSPEYQPDGQLSRVKAQEMMRLAAERGFNFFEWTHKRVNGQEFFATVTLTRMKLGGQVVLQAAVRDITDQVLSQKELAKKMRNFEIFYKSAIDREMTIKELKKKVQELENQVKG